SYSPIYTLFPYTTLFRSLEFFCKPGTDMEWFEYWRNFCRNWLLNLGMKEESLRLRDHSKEELSFYSTGTTDIEFLFPFGWGELRSEEHTSELQSRFDLVC